MEQIKAELEAAGFDTKISGDAAWPILVTYAIDEAGDMVPLCISWSAEKGLWKLSSFPHSMLPRIDCDRLLEVYAALDLIPIFVIGESGWDIGAAVYATADDIATKAINFLASVRALHHVVERTD